MQQNYQTTEFPTLGTQTTWTGGATWSNPNNITADDAATAYLGLAGSGAASLFGKNFDINLPPGAKVDGLSIYIDCLFQFGGWGVIDLSTNLPGTDSKDALVVDGQKGSPTDLWGADSITPADLANLEVTLFANGTVDDIIEINYITVTVYWHIEPETAPSDVPIRVDYKVYSRNGDFLGLLPNVSSPFAFSQDVNSAGATLDIICGEKAENITTVDPILTDDGDEILTDDNQPILADTTELRVASGASPYNAIFKNSNRIMVWMYNYWYPNGKLMFSGQVNKIGFQYGGGDSSVKLSVLSDGFDLNNFIARGYPFAYTTDISQTSQNGYVTVTQASSGGWQRYGQTWISGVAATNVGAIVLRLYGTANVTVSIYNRVNGSLLGSVTQSVKNGAAAAVSFEFPQLIPISPSTEYFMTVSVNSGKSIRVYKHSTSGTYANGTMYTSTYGGGSGGGSYDATTGDFYFITKYGTPTTTTTYSTDDPVSEMMHGILLDYNARGGFITERDFLPTGLSLTYQFNQSTIFDALKKVLDLSQTGYYAYVDLGTAEMDILQQSTTADFTVVRGKDINTLNLTLSIEQVKNYLLFTGGPNPTTNLYRQYQDTDSSSFYGLRTVPQTDNRVTSTTTADAIGTTFIEENSDETQETTLIVNVENFDTALLVPGKTVGFRNFNEFIDEMVLQIVRREFNTKTVTLTLGRLPVRTNDQIQKITRGLLNEQTLSNPSAPS